MKPVITTFRRLDMTSKHDALEYAALRVGCAW